MNAPSRHISTRLEAVSRLKSIIAAVDRERHPLRESRTRVSVEVADLRAVLAPEQEPTPAPDAVVALARDGWALVAKAQDILATYLDPGATSIQTEHEAVNALLALLDNAAVVKRGREARQTILPADQYGTPEEWEDFRDAQVEGWGGTFDEWRDRRADRAEEA